MELYDVVARRRMTRSFTSDPVEDEVVERVVAAGLRAPSAGFSEGVELLVLKNEDRRQRFWELVAEEGFATSLRPAPVIVLIVTDSSAYVARYAEADKTDSFLFRLAPSKWPVPYWTVDAAFVAMLVLLACEQEGLGALFFHLQGRDREVLAGLGVPDRFETIGAIALGRRAPRKSAPARRSSRGSARLHVDHF